MTQPALGTFHAYILLTLAFSLDKIQVLKLMSVEIKMQWNGRSYHHH